MNKLELTRRGMLGTMMGLAMVPSAVLAAEENAEEEIKEEDLPMRDASAKVITGDPRVRGPFPILSTPFLENGDVDYETLAQSAKFVDWAQCHGMIWPQANDAVDLLTKEEKLKGMTVLAETMKGRKSALCLGVNGRNTADMLDYARHAESLEPAAIISRPPNDAKTEDDLYAYWRELMKIVNRPVIIQTSGPGKSPSTKLLIQLGEESEYFGYVKEETAPFVPRMKELVAAKPKIKRVMSAWGGFTWLHNCRIGIEGLVTERAVYADLLGKMWRAYDSGDYMTACDMFSKVVFMLNLKETIHCAELRGFHLYCWQKRGVFKNRLSRNYGPNGSIPEKPILSEMELSQDEMDELDMRLDFITPAFRDGILCPDLG